jgi:glycosyltransferase involved in cell wall biosynthesis
MAGDLSVIIPAHNAAATLESTLRSASVADGLLEVVVVDDGSTDGTAALVEQLIDQWSDRGGARLRLVSQPQGGPSDARNRGAREAIGGVFCFLDADDTWLSPTPDPRRSKLADDRSAVSLGQVLCLGGDPPVPTGEPFAGFFTGAALIGRQAFDAVGPFDSALSLGEDLDWFLRARESGLPLSFHPEVALGYRLRPGSLSARRDARSHGLLVALHHAVDRRRPDQEVSP